MPNEENMYFGPRNLDKTSELKEQKKKHVLQLLHNLLQLAFMSLHFLLEEIKVPTQLWKFKDRQVWCSVLHTWFSITYLRTVCQDRWYNSKLRKQKLKLQWIYFLSNAKIDSNQLSPFCLIEQIMRQFCTKITFNKKKIWRNEIYSEICTKITWIFIT